MHYSLRLACVLLVVMVGCSKPPSPRRDVGETAWPKDWSGRVGQPVTLEGTAVNAKLGAALIGEDDLVWIDGLDAWPDGFYSGGDQGKRLRVTGVVIRRDDVPVFVPEPGEPMKAGVPVTSEAEREKAKWRYLLRDAKWTVLD
ncbi:MAG: hypothetical protein AVDCRST_MAG64-1751 [uncultured Phycisphaerae bacterium]|uniref:Uncharacterized protein n=1 Tax=uncultured Phycisphaerae bacterium TaxID=904963 RepID=A0A6J4NZX9_9BACT|nr:MAG: hypothetical protein AVDCRST_MAG64-1751 [uncultured Phycisphaerae bacterium]